VPACLDGHLPATVNPPAFLRLPAYLDFLPFLRYLMRLGYRLGYHRSLRAPPAIPPANTHLALTPAGFCVSSAPPAPAAPHCCYSNILVLWSRVWAWAVRGTCRSHWLRVLLRYLCRRHRALNLCLPALLGSPLRLRITVPPYAFCRLHAPAVIPPPRFTALPAAACRAALPLRTRNHRTTCHAAWTCLPPAAPSLFLHIQCAVGTHLRPYDRGPGSGATADRPTCLPRDAYATVSHACPLPFAVFSTSTYKPFCACFLRDHSGTCRLHLLHLPLRHTMFLPAFWDIGHCTVPFLHHLQEVYTGSAGTTLLHYLYTAPPHDRLPGPAARYLGSCHLCAYHTAALCLQWVSPLHTPGRRFCSACMPG